jgi:hypothetical protein
MNSIKLNIQLFAYNVTQGESQTQAQNIIDAANELSTEITRLSNSFINQMPTVWYTKTSYNTTNMWTSTFNSEIVNKINTDFNILLQNYINTVNSLLRESGEIISGSVPRINNVTVNWSYSAGSKNILPASGELSSFVNNNAKPVLDNISSIAAKLRTRVSSASDMDSNSKSAILTDLETVSSNASSLSSQVNSAFTTAASREEENVQSIQTVNKGRN